MNVQAFLDRVGYTGTRECTRENLALLIREHQENVPFENLDYFQNPHGGSIDVEKLYDKVVTRRRGGVCYELNGLLYAMLRELGYECYPVDVRLHREPGVPAPYSHQGIVAVVDGRKYYCDVGFGGPGPKGLVDLDDTQVQELYGSRFRASVDGLYRKIQWFHDGDWFDQISFTDVPVIPEDYEARLFFFTANPASYFVIARMVNLCLPTGSAALSGNHLTIRKDGQVTEKDLTTDEELTQALKDVFGIVL